MFWQVKIGDNENTALYQGDNLEDMCQSAWNVEEWMPYIYNTAVTRGKQGKWNLFRNTQDALGRCHTVPLIT